MPCADTWRLPVEVRERRSSSAILIVLGCWTSSLRILRLWIWGGCGATEARMQHRRLRSRCATRGRWSCALSALREPTSVTHSASMRYLTGDRSSAPRSISEVAASLGVSVDSLYYYSPARSAGLVGEAVNRSTLLVSPGFVIGFMPALWLLLRCSVDPLSEESRGPLASRLSWL